MRFTLHGKAALLTGSRRIGAAIATALGERGVDIALSYNRSREEAEAAADTVRRAGRRAVAIQADVSQPASCTALVDGAAAELGRLDILINMASVYSHVAFEATNVSQWDAVMNVDLRSAFLCSRAAVPYMRAAGGGRIINFSDWIAASGRPRYPGYVAYYVAKRGVIGLTEALALELSAEQILVNAIAPGPILAPEGTSTEELEAVEKATPVGHWGGEPAIVAATMFLLESTFVTGETIRVDGGRHIK